MQGLQCCTLVVPRPAALVAFDDMLLPLAAAAAGGHGHNLRKFTLSGEF